MLFNEIIIAKVCLYAINFKPILIKLRNYICLQMFMML
jgi:hypothetical protein